MAYNTSTGSRDFDDMRYQQDRDTQIDWDQDSISFKTNDVTRVVIDNSAISASGDATFVGATVVGSTFNVSGATTLAGDTTFTNISGSGTLQAVGKTVLGNTLIVSGNVGLGTGPVPDGKLHIMKASAGSIVASADGNALVVENSDVAGMTFLSPSDGVIYFGDASDNDIGRIIYHHTSDSMRLWTNNAERVRIDSSGKFGIGTNDPTQELTVAGDVSGSGTLQIVGNTFLGGNLEVSGTTSYSGGTTFTNISGSGTLQAVGATTLGNTLTVSGAVKVAQKIEHAGDPDTYIEFTTDSMAVVVGAEQMIIAIEGGGGAQADKVTINNGSEDVDFQVKGSSVPNLIRTDAANDKVGIGMADSTFASDTLTVVGTISGSSTLQAVGNTFLGGTLNVTGATTLAGNTAFTNISGSGTIQSVNHVYVGNNLFISGNIDIAGGFALGSDAEGDMYYRNSAGALTRLAKGSDNEVLTMNVNVPNWEAAAGGISFNGSTANGLVTFGNASTADVESDILFNAGNLTMNASISGSGTLQMVGNTFIGGDLKASGSLRAKQIHVTQHGFNSTSTAYQYVPFYSEAEQGSPNYRSSMIAPFKGRLLRVLWRCQQDINPSEVTVGVFTGSMGNSGPNTVVAEHVVMAPIAGAYQVTTFNFTGSQHFIAGDTITIGVKSGANPGTQNATGIWEYDMSEI